MNNVAGFLSHWNWIDVIVLICLARFGYIGASQGFGGELVRSVGVVTGVVVSFRWYQAVGDWVAARTVLSHEWAAAGVLVLLVVGTYGLIVLGLRLLQHAVTLKFAPSLDKVGGLGLGLLRAALVVSVGLVMLQQLPSDYVRTSIEERSWSGRYLVRAAPAVYDAVNPWMARVVPSWTGPQGAP
ncbi:MAG: hypothetical protein A3C53_03815 [Omnitrophica WOR_2 bacterium RIFCSPHIGHO2_02_FULL_68_15]|nr:MAG: hypothetical protein A3C53_03815 [Omnitrophica WOR_2 bacterium RIFCSPHIGHO2_02_FULL_68_15]